MEVAATIALINGLISTARNVREAYAEANGQDSIPSWDAIISNNADLQKKIDAEKGGK